MSFPNLSALAVRERAVTLFFLILAVVGGLFAFLSLGRAEDPAFTVRVMMVSVLWPGATPQELQDQVVDRLEKRIQEVEYLHRIETTVRPGRADLQVEFHDYAPQARIRDLFYEVRKRMQDEAPRLPPGALGPFVNDDFSDVYFALIALTAPGLPHAALVEAAEGVRDRLQGVEGVHKAILLGERPERLYVEFDSARLANLGVSPDAVFAAIDAHNRLVPAGRVDSRGPRLYLRVDRDLSEPEKLAAVPLAVGDRVFRLGDIATVRRGYEEPPSYLVRARGEEAVLLGVVMQKGENGLAFGERLRAFVARENSRLPLGMGLALLTHQADAIARAVNLFELKFLAALVAVMGVSMLALGLRAGIVVGVAVPVTLGLTFLAMKALGINLDRITLGALIISLGLLVDDAIIAVEMMLVKMEQGWDKIRAAAHAWNVTAAPMLVGTLVTAAGFLPIGFARSGVGEYAGNIFWVLGLSLVISWLVAVVFTPYLGVSLLPARPAQSHADPYATRGYQRLRALIRLCVERRKTVVAITLALLALSAVLLTTAVQKQFFPGSDRPEVLVSVYAPQGSSITVTDATVRRLEELLKSLPEVKTLSAYVGGGAPRFFISANPEPPDPAFAKLVAVTGNAAERDRVIRFLRARIEAGDFPEARIRVARLLYGPPVPWPVTFRVMGPDPQVLRDIAHRVRALMEVHPNVRDAHLEWDERAPVLHISMDADRLARLGLTPLHVAQQLQFQLEGGSVTQVRRGRRAVEVIARGHPEGASFEVRNREGRKIPLSQLGQLQIRYEEPVIKRYNRTPFVAVLADVEGAQANDVTAVLWQHMEELRRRLPEGYRIDTGGSVEQSAKAENSIRRLQPLMVAVMLILIMLQMRSFSGTFMVVATAPLGLIGAVAALLLFRQPFGFVALLGLIGLAGILMRNTLILTQQVKDNLAQGQEAEHAVVEAAVSRARPVVLTALAAALAFVPLTFDAFWGPVAFVLAGGVIAGTAITLLFVPALYALWFRLPAGGPRGLPA
ncbi:MAG: efflux RND transporter permease subunit [Burkholderiales bacterium]|nr:efflux RND transporter permease subunit [Burkholderiales bacterium]